MIIKHYLVLHHFLYALKLNIIDFINVCDLLSVI